MIIIVIQQKSINVICYICIVMDNNVGREFKVHIILQVFVNIVSINLKCN